VSYAPATLLELGAFYRDQGGVNLGIVGNTAHTIGYHLGRDRIYDGSGPGIGDQDYSVRAARDRAGLSNAASAIDFGRIAGSLDELYRFSRWLVARCQAGAPGYRDVREVIYSPDGKRVQRWSGIDGLIHTGPGNGDASHIGHTHVSYFRDSEQRSKLALVSPFFDEEQTMDFYPVAGGDGVVTLKAGRGLVNLVTGEALITDDVTKTTFGRVHLAEPFGDGPGRQDGYLVRHANQAHLALDDVVASFEPADPPVPGPDPVSQPYAVTVGGKLVGAVELP